MSYMIENGHKVDTTRRARRQTLPVDLNSDGWAALATLRTLFELAGEDEAEVLSGAVEQLRDARLAKLRR